MSNESTVWQGVLIEESLNGVPIPPEFHVLATKPTTLESEEEKGAFHFHSVETEDKDKDAMINFISNNIRESWYFHLVKGDEMIVTFHNKIFKARKYNKEEIEAIRIYALSQGIHKDQLPLEQLFEDPFH